ncbi:Hypothetical protein NTJ_14468 [Nesidiocoris tenuis]|uniref:WD repeat-containing protein 60 n=1 Tax=Nesidiocoris tenuis TaxID=355587 RepID=A0ABN7BB83_9HEMI|nr:Hypothetical protein NTJ_14468 [Nesidiocoris tenuis]
MAKKSAGASEINGFISINNDKSKSTIKTSTAKKTVTSTSRSTVRSNDPKAVKDAPPTKPTAKKIQPSDRLSKAEKATKPTASTISKGSKTTAEINTSSSKSTKNVVSNKAPSKRPVAGQRTTPEKNQSTANTPLRATTKGPSKPVTKNETQPKPQSKDRKVVAKADPGGAVKPGTRTVKPVVDKRNTLAKTSTDKNARVGSQKEQQQISKARPLKAKEKLNSVQTPPNAEQKVLGKNGLSYNVVLEPAKSAKPKSLADNDRSRSVDNQKADNLPSQLVKQRTFVKDDEQLKSSIPNISDPDETVAKDEYEEDFEEYESDFEDETETETSISEASRAAVMPRQSVEPIPSTSKLKIQDPKRETQLDEKSSAIRRESISAKSIESSKPVEPAAQKTVESEKIAETSVYDYEDDFEDYSSDFEEDTESGFTSSNETTSESTETSSSENDDLTSDLKVGSKTKMVVEEERKLDSGNYDMKTSALRNEAIRLNQLNDIKEAISRENTMFKEGHASEKTLVSPTIQILDFKAAVDQAEKKSKRDPSRGKLLMSMIKLHEMDYHLFEMQPLPYEDFIQLRGNLNFRQEQTQTGDDDVGEETQTDEIAIANKWTQCPVSYHSWAGKEIDWGVYMQDKRGFGSDDTPPLTRQQISATNYNAKRLHSFVSAATQLITVILEEEAQGFTNILSLRKSEKNFGFSDGYVPIYCDDIDFLKDRRVTHIAFSPHFPNIVVACYDASATSEADYLPAEITKRWLVCLWDIIVVSQPLKILVASAPIRSIIFDCLYSDLVYAGLSNGIICLWDLSEPDQEHDHCEHKNFKPILRSPTYSTFAMATDSRETHTNSVVELKSRCYSKRHDEDVTPTTLFSMCEDGLIILWTVVRIPDSSSRQQRKADVRLSPWGRVTLSLTSIHRPKISAPKDLRPHLELTCMAIKESSVSSVLLGTNKGSVLQYPMVRLKTVIPKFGDTNIALQVTAIELCPHDTKCFLVGISDGSVRLHTEDVSRPLKTLAVPDLPPTAIVSLKWSNFKAGLIVSLDQNSNLLVWNICKSDLYPLVKMAFKLPDTREALLQKAAASNPNLQRDELERIVKFVLPTSGLRRLTRMSRMDLSGDVRLPYLGVVVSDATVHVHRLNEEFAPKGADVKNDDLLILKSYLGLLHV